MMRRNQWRFAGKPQAKSKVLEKLQEEKEEDLPPPFNIKEIICTVEDIVERTINRMEDTGEKNYGSINLCHNISEEIRDNLKTWPSLKKFRMIVVCSLIEKHSQSVNSKLAHSLDQKKEGIVRYCYENSKYFISLYIALVTKNGQQ